MKENGLEISTVEMHTGEEPLRIIASGFLAIKGDTILDKRRYVQENLDHLRKLLMFEPRGHYVWRCDLNSLSHSFVRNYKVATMRDELIY